MATTGSIVFRIYTSAAQIPVERAVVILSSPESGSLLGVRVTNSSGKTEPIAIETAPAALGTTPETTKKPWQECSARIEHPEFERTTINGIQIFPDVLTLQDVSLLPLTEFNSEKDGEIVYNFTPQPVWEEE